MNSCVAEQLPQLTLLAILTVTEHHYLEYQICHPPKRFLDGDFFLLRRVVDTHGAK